MGRRRRTMLLLVTVVSSRRRQDGGSRGDRRGGIPRRHSRRGGVHNTSRRGNETSHVDLPQTVISSLFYCFLQPQQDLLRTAQLGPLLRNRPTLPHVVGTNSCPYPSPLLTSTLLLPTGVRLLPTNPDLLPSFSRWRRPDSTRSPVFPPPPPPLPVAAGGERRGGEREGGPIRSAQSGSGSHLAPVGLHIGGPAIKKEHFFYIPDRRVFWVSSTKM